VVVPIGATVLCARRTLSVPVDVIVLKGDSSAPGPAAHPDRTGLARELPRKAPP